MRKPKRKFQQVEPPKVPYVGTPVGEPKQWYELECRGCGTRWITMENLLWHHCEKKWGKPKEKKKKLSCEGTVPGDTA